MLLLAVATARLDAAAVFLDTAETSEPAGLLGVMAAGNTELILALTSAEVIEPELSADLSLVGGVLVAPLVKGITPALQRMGTAQAGVQRFRFSLEIPAADKSQRLLLRMRVKTHAAETWLPLPVVMLEAVPRTWKRTLQQFVAQHASGRLAGSERLDRLFQQAGVDIPETATDSPVETSGVRVWFADAQTHDVHLPETHGSVLWLVFKKTVPGGVALRRPVSPGPLCLLIDERALVSADSSAAAQALLERALAFAGVLASGESELSPP